MCILLGLLYQYIIMMHGPTYIKKKLIKFITKRHNWSSGHLCCHYCYSLWLNQWPCICSQHTPCNSGHVLVGSPLLCAVTHFTYGNCLFQHPTLYLTPYSCLVLSSLQDCIQRYITNHSKFKRKVVSVHAVQTHGTMKVQLHPFLLAALVEGELSSSCCSCFIPEEITPSTH